MKRYLSAFLAVLAAATIAVAAIEAAASSAKKKKAPVPRPRPTAASKLVAVAPAATPRTAVPFAPAATATTSAADVGAVRQALDLARKGKTGEATEVEKTIADPLARKLVEWIILRADNNGVDFDRYVAFINANPSWPSVALLRKRAEGALWQERRDPATVRNFFATAKPSTARGRFALARALLAQGDRAGAELHVRQAWRSEPFSQELEEQVTEAFRDFINRADHKSRMDRLLYPKGDVAAAMRAAKRLGAAELAIAKARIAVATKSGKVLALLDAVPAEARRDAGYTLARMHWLMRNDRVAEAARLMIAAPRDVGQIHDADEWWRERRTLARKLLDAGDAQTAYLVVRDAAVPAIDNYRAEQHFMAGWIALRYLNDAAAAAVHFTRIGQGSANPIVLARAGYWQGRAAEALGRHQDARAHYEAAARHSTAYYGQLARSRLGGGEMVLRRLPEPDAAHRTALMGLEVVRAVEILYAIGERDLVVPIAADLAERSIDTAALAALAEIAGRHEDARAMLLIGKAALARGFAFDLYAFPNIGIPRYTAVGPEVDRSVVYSIARTESSFDQRDFSAAKAVGLMQVTPAAGRDTAKRYGIAFDWRRMVSDPVYNTQMGAAELGGLFEDYRGSYILTFAGYNAGRGRVREWIGRMGDPRDPKVDPIDWVERIPFAETRNYVQRVMENLQVYRVRFGAGTRLMIEADLRRGAVGN